MKYKKMFLLFSHKLNSEQIKEAKEALHVEEFIYLSDELQSIWSNISPDIDSLKDTLKPVKEFLAIHVQSDDVALIQGDFGATYLMIEHLKALHVKCVYATTLRVVKEFSQNGEDVKKSVFKFRRFREYGV